MLTSLNLFVNPKIRPLIVEITRLHGRSWLFQIDAISRCKFYILAANYHRFEPSWKFSPSKVCFDCFENANYHGA